MMCNMRTAQRRSRSECVPVQFDLHILCSWTYITVSIDSTTVATDSVSGQQNAQADQGLFL